MKSSQFGTPIVVWAADILKGGPTLQDKSVQAAPQSRDSTFAWNDLTERYEPQTKRTDLADVLTPSLT